MSAADIGIGIAAASAVASAVSAFESARSVALSHRPFVVGTAGSAASAEGDLVLVSVTVRNNGPGIAMNVHGRAHAWNLPITTYWSPPLGSLPTGEEAFHSEPCELPPGYERNDAIWYVETEFSDIRGGNWRVMPEDGIFSNERQTRVRSSRFDLWRPKRASPNHWP
jgi:hypothetical protein